MPPATQKLLASAFQSVLGLGSTPGYFQDWFEGSACFMSWI